MSLHLIQFRQAADLNVGTPYKWSNIFYVNADDAAEAAAIGVTAWSSHFADCFRTNVYCYEVYSRDTLPVTVDFAIVPVDAGDQRGSNSVATAPLPSFNVVRVDLNVPAARPMRKFLRLPVDESDIVDGSWSNEGYATGINGFLTGMISTYFLVNPDGVSLTSAVFKGITSRRLGKLAYTAVPSGPPVG